MQTQRGSEKPKGQFKQQLKVVMKWIELVNKQRKTTDVSFAKFLDFLQVRYDQEELNLVNQYIQNNFDSDFNQDVLIDLLTPSEQIRSKRQKNVLESFLLLTGGNKVIQSRYLLEILTKNSRIDENVLEAIEKIEVNGMIDVSKLVEYLV